MQIYKKYRILGLVALSIYISLFWFDSFEAMLLKWSFLACGLFFFRKAHFEEKKLFGDDPNDARKRKKLAYIIVGALYGFAILVFIGARCHGG